ncbi:MAG TPA: (Fe-S)-binding protein, partial [Hyphomicrobiales bacterium]|nr:(Fe-S)-binding protein [Hyphomicrobiales bacterium]
KVHELVSFLVDVCGVEAVAARCDATATYHDACSGLRELGVRTQPRKLLATVEGLTLHELAEPDVCCGFGGTFAVKYPDISGTIVAEKAAAVEATGARLVLAGDLGCLMNIAGRLSREGSPVAVRHVAEVLAGMTDAAPIGAPEGRAP